MYRGQSQNISLRLPPYANDITFAPQQAGIYYCRAKLYPRYSQLESGVILMKPLVINHNILLIVIGIFLGQVVWPATGLPILLGPAFLLGLAPLRTLSLGLYLLATLVSAGLGTLQADYWLGLIILLQFLLWYWAHTKQHTGWWVVSTLLPIGLLLWLQADKTYLVYLMSLVSAACQTVLYRGLATIAKHKIKQLKEEHRHRQGADRLLAAINHFRELEQLPSLAKALNETMEQTYGIYQDMELIARTTPKLPQPMVQNILAAAQQIHQIRLQLQDWHQQQEQVLGDLLGRDTMSLQTLCTWVSLLVTDLVAKGGQQLETLIDFEEETWLKKAEQLPLGSLLLFICLHGLSKLTDVHISLRFSGYVASEGLRLIITIAPKLDAASGEWPELRPCDLSQVRDHAQRLNAICLTGVTSQGEHIYTLELN